MFRSRIGKHHHQQHHAHRACIFSFIRCIEMRKSGADTRFIPGIPDTNIVAGLDWSNRLDGGKYNVSIIAICSERIDHHLFGIFARWLANFADRSVREAASRVWMYESDSFSGLANNCEWTLVELMYSIIYWINMVGEYSYSYTFNYEHCCTAFPDVELYGMSIFSFTSHPHNHSHNSRYSHLMLHTLQLFVYFHELRRLCDTPILQTRTRVRHAPFTCASTDMWNTHTNTLFEKVRLFRCSGIVFHLCFPYSDTKIENR